MTKVLDKAETKNGELRQKLLNELRLASPVTPVEPNTPPAKAGTACGTPTLDFGVLAAPQS